MKLTRRKNNKLRRNFQLLAWSTLLAETRLYYPVAVLAFEAVTGSFTEAMSVFAIQNICQALFELPTGVFSDKIGRRMTLVIGAGVEALGGLCIASAFFMTNGLWALYVAALCIGFSDAMFSGNNDALLYETLAYYRRTKEAPKAIGRVHSMGQIGLGLASALAIVLLFAGMSYKDLAVLSFFPVFAGFLLTFFIVEPPYRKDVQEKTFDHLKKAFELIVKNSRLRWLAIASVIRYGLGSSAHTFKPGFVVTVWPMWLVPLYTVGQNVVGFFGFWFAGRIIKRVGLMRSLLSFTVCIYFINGIAYGIATALSPVLMIVTQLSYAVCLTAENALKQANFSKAQRSTMGSLISLVTSIIGGISSVFIGVLADRFGPTHTLLIVVGISSFVTVIYIKLYNREYARKDI